MNSGTGFGTPQFDKVEYQAPAGTSSCVFCNQPISSPYYRVNGEQACAACVEKEQAARRDSARNYSRALTFGIGAAIVGLIGYAAFEIITGWIIGYISLGVGWLIAKAMLKGSNGLGGRKYQITAVLLTYFAVSLAAIPVWISVISKEKKERSAQVAVQPSSQNPQSSASTSGKPVAPSSSNSTTATAPDNTPAVGSDTASASPSQSAQPEAKMGLGKALGALLLIGLASPFLGLAAGGFQGLIGLFILFIGMQIAWKMTGRPTLAIDGPF